MVRLFVQPGIPKMACPIGSVLLLHVTVWSDVIGQLSRHTCEEKSSCLSNLTNEKHRTCWCDDKCLQYDQCCHDYQPTREESNRYESYKEKWNDLKTRIKCKYFPPISNRPLYIITDCPRDSFPIDVIRSRCEGSRRPPVASSKKLLMAKLRKMRQNSTVRSKKSVDESEYEYLNYIPVTGLTVDVVYRNAFCALCNNEYNFVFFNLEIFSRRAFSVEDFRNSSALRQRLREAQLHRKYRYKHPAARPTRTCVPTVSGCGHAWADDVTASRCRRGATALVRDYATGIVYRNVYCALCRSVNETRLRCESRYLVSAKYPPAPRFPLPYALLIDVNTGLLRPASVRVGYVPEAASASAATVAEEDAFPICRRLTVPGTNVSAEVTVSAGLMDDGSCDLVDCPDGYQFVDGQTTCAAVEDERPTNGTYAFKFGPGLGYLTLVGNCLSMAGLVVLLSVYSSLPCLRNTPGKCLMSLASTLLAAQLLFTAAVGRTDVVVLCLGVSLSEHYLLLVHALWTNVMAFDVWRVFRAATRHSGASASSRFRTFSLYSAYAWLLPLPVVAWSALADVLDLHLRPRYGDRFCWIGDRRALMYYFALPLGVVVLANTGLFLATLRNIHATSAATAAARRPCDVTSGKRRLLLYFRLAVVMAITWLFGFLAALVDHVILWYAFTLANAFQGLYLCAAFVFTKKVHANTILKIRRLASRTRSRSYSGSTTRETNDFKPSTNVNKGCDVRQTETNI